MTEEHQRLIVVNDQVERAHRKCDVAGRGKRGKTIANARRIGVDRMDDVWSTHLQQGISNERGVANEATRSCRRRGERVVRHLAHRTTDMLRVRGQRGDRERDDYECDYPEWAREQE